MREDTGQRFGLKDQPIEHIEQEALGLGEYAEVLTEFIEACDTPITIALQGDWGSGKTSLMTLIRNALVDDAQAGRYLTVWFNTWQYAQFNMSDTLALSMMSKITDELGANAESDAFKALKRGLWTATRAAVIGGASLVGQADTVKGVLDEAERRPGESGAEDVVAALEQIKDGLNEIVQQRVSGPAKKVVIFIDDLDRLVPERAVELLEAMKIFLDIDRCVYVIACDYSVVAAGLKKKFGIAEGEVKGKSFFDKIIQVPFKMPTRRYKVEEYIDRLLKQIGMDFETKEDISTYRDLVEHSVGFNPRTMKRLLNTLQLLTILDRRRREGENVAAQTDGEDDRRRHACRVTFGILCMLERYEALYDYITEELTADRILNLRSGLKADEDFAELRMKLGPMNGHEKNQDKSVQYDKKAVDEASSFLDSFVDCLQLDDDNNLSDDEIDHLATMLSQSALVSSARVLHEFSPRDFALDLRGELNGKYSTFVKGARPKYDMFRMEQGTVYLNLPKSKDHGGWWFLMGRDEDVYYFEIRSWTNGNVPVLGALICEELGWEPGVELDPDGYTVYRFFTQTTDSPDALSRYKAELVQRLNQLTESRSLLWRLCDQASSG